MSKIPTRVKENATRQFILLGFAYLIGIFFFSLQKYFWASLIFIFSSMEMVSTFDYLFQKKLETYQNWPKIRTMIYLFVLCSVSGLGIYFEAVVAKEGIKSEFFLDEHIPEFEYSKEKFETPSYTYAVNLDKADSPVYIAIEAISDSRINFKFEDQNGKNTLWDINNFGFLCIDQCPTLVLETCYSDNDQYNLTLQLLRQGDGPLHLQVYKTDYAKYIDIDYSNCTKP